MEPSPLDHIEKQLDEALNRLEDVWAQHLERSRGQADADEQKHEQYIESLKLQIAHWRSLSQKSEHEATQKLNAQKQELERKFAQAQKEAKTWREKASSWKEEARRAEKARIAALHKGGLDEVKTLIAETDQLIGEAVGHIRSHIGMREAEVKKRA